jgi:hypothetical protein
MCYDFHYTLLHSTIRLHYMLQLFLLSTTHEHCDNLELLSTNERDS